MSVIKLTEFTRGGGCGCKVSPAVLQEILQHVKQNKNFPSLLVGKDTADDAAVYSIGNGQAIISTADFFMPVVDDAYDFGRIAAANSLSDVYAMGGKPIMAIALLGWPTEKIDASEASKVLQGAQAVCAQAQIPLAGGHTVDSVEPFFGLAVTGLVNEKNIKRNNTVHEGDVLFLTKPIGSGILASAFRKEQLQPGHYPLLAENMATLNSIGQKLGDLEYVHAMTDVTGFGLVGHLMEMLTGNEFSAEIEMKKLPVLEGAMHYMARFLYPDNTTRIYNSYKEAVQWPQGLEFLLLCDPQTSGGLLFSVAKEKVGEVETFLKAAGVEAWNIGSITAKQEKKIVVL